ncbi:MAG: hypothetical protein H6747_15285 [Deltaproteobacteria bacterium]|nr:hypothetical protein [Deltaproteobacteria bacterium]
MRTPLLLIPLVLLLACSEPGHAGADSLAVPVDDAAADADAVADADADAVADADADADAVADADADADAVADAVADADVVADAAPDGTPSQQPLQTSVSFGSDLVSILAEPLADGRRRYTLTTTHPLRDGVPKDGKRTFEEPPGAARLRSPNLALDAFYALAQAERVQASVAAIQNGQWNGGQPLPCPCFETGEKWTFAWTRDSSYAIALGLSLHDPIRSRETLRFLLRAPKQGGSKRIIQDTGTGGSWPVSTDRVVWARAALAVSRVLPSAESALWIEEATPAILASLQDDIALARDPQSGLIRGETSFLDWRQQTYPDWMAGESTPIARTFALSTNVLWTDAWASLAAMRANVGDALGAAAAKSEADAQRAQLAAFWQAAQVPIGAEPGRTLPPAWLGAPLDPQPAGRADTLAIALAALTDAIDPTTARAWLARLPFADAASAAGPAVFYPPARQAIYHNRATWPIVTGYVALAAAHVRAPDPFAAAAAALVRYALLNLSNMENFAWPGGQNWLADSAGGFDASGPVVNSRRQLWSVGAALALVDGGLFGLQPQIDGVEMRPMVPRSWAAAWLPDGGTLRLEGLKLRNIALTLELQVPKLGPGPGTLALQSVVLVGASSGTTQQVALVGTASVVVAKEAALLAASQDGGAVLSLTLSTSATDTAAPTLQPAPPAPSVAGLLADPPPLTVQLADANDPSKGVTLGYDAADDPPSFEIFRDGALIGTTGATSYTDPVADAATTTHCWSVVGVLANGLRTRHAATRCHWGKDFERILDISALAAREGGSALVALGGNPAGYARRVPLVGAEEQVLAVEAFLPRWSGPHLLEVQHGGPAEVTTGMHALGLRVRVERLRDGAVVVDAPATLGAHVEGNAPRGSTAVTIPALDVEEAYRVLLTRPAVASMANLSHASFYGGPGGDGTSGSAYRDVHALRLLTMQGQAEAAPPPWAFDGVGDFDKTPATAQLTPGITLQPWERFALTWDARWLTGVVVAEAFEDPTKAFVLYVEVVDPSAPTPPQTATGMTYLGLTPKLAFTPTAAIGLRAGCDLGDGYGPWCGVFARDPKTGTFAQHSRLAPGQALGGAGIWLAADKHTISFRIPRAALGAAAMAAKAGGTAKAATLRITGHLVHGGAGDEWKDVVPPFAMPWKNAATGYYEIDLGKAAAVANWAAK